MTVNEVIQFLSGFKQDSQVLIESSDGEYGPVSVRYGSIHAGEAEPCGVDLPNKWMKGCPVLRA